VGLLLPPLGRMNAVVVLSRMSPLTRALGARFALEGLALANLVGRSDHCEVWGRRSGIVLRQGSDN